MTPREILARAMYDSQGRPCSWEKIRPSERTYWLSLADAAMAVSKPFNAAVWEEGYDAGQRSEIYSTWESNPYVTREENA